MKTKPHGKGIVKALGQKKTTGNFKKIEAAKGKDAAIGALQNKLAKKRGEPIPYTGKKKGNRPPAKFNANKFEATRKKVFNLPSNE